MRQTTSLIFVLIFFSTLASPAHVLSLTKKSINLLPKKELRQQRKQERRKERLQKLKERFQKIISRKIEKRKKCLSKRAKVTNFWLDFLEISLYVIVIGGLFFLAFFSSGTLQTLAIILLSVFGTAILFVTLFLILIVKAFKK